MAESFSTKRCRLVHHCTSVLRSAHHHRRRVHEDRAAAAQGSGNEQEQEGRQPTRREARGDHEARADERCEDPGNGRRVIRRLLVSQPDHLHHVQLRLQGRLRQHVLPLHRDPGVRQLLHQPLHLLVPVRPVQKRPIRQMSQARGIPRYLNHIGRFS